MSVFSDLQRLRAAYAVGAARLERGLDRRVAHTKRLGVTMRMRRGQVDLIDKAARTVFGNFVAGLVIAVVIRHEVSPVALGLWLAGLVLVSWGLNARVKWHHKQHSGDRIPPEVITRRLNDHALFSVALGLVWAAFIVWCGPTLPNGRIVILSLIVIGCISGSVSAIGPSLPVFFGYFLTVLPALIYANLMQTSPNGRLYAFLIALYGAALIVNALTLNRSILSALRQRARNELLADSLAVAEAATEAATRSKWESFAHLSHELRTPMNAVLGFSDMMRQQMFGGLTPRYLDYAQSIHSSGSEALALIDSILEVSRARTGTLALSETHFDPVILIEKLAHDFAVEAAAAGIEIETMLRDPDVLLHADENNIRQVLHNLMSNALKYTKPGGRVSLSLTYDEVGLCVTVSDTGVGIAADEIALCQEPFVRLGDPLVSRSNGAGLGLPIAKHLLEAHGGNLSIESRLGMGTAVTIVLPPSRCVQKPDEVQTPREMPYLRLVGRE